MHYEIALNFLYSVLAGLVVILAVCIYEFVRQYIRLARKSYRSSPVLNFEINEFGISEHFLLISDFDIKYEYDSILMKIENEQLISAYFDGESINHQSSYLSRLRGGMNLQNFRLIDMVATMPGSSALFEQRKNNPFALCMSPVM